VSVKLNETAEFVVVEKATDVCQVSEDWGLYMEICDLVNSSEDG